MVMRSAMLCQSSLAHPGHGPVASVSVKNAFFELFFQPFKAFQ